MSFIDCYCLVLLKHLCWFCSVQQIIKYLCKSRLSNCDCPWEGRRERGGGAGKLHSGIDVDWCLAITLMELLSQKPFLPPFLPSLQTRGSQRGKKEGKEIPKLTANYMTSRVWTSERERLSQTQSVNGFVVGCGERKRTVGRLSLSFVDRTWDLIWQNIVPPPSLFVKGSQCISLMTLW